MSAALEGRVLSAHPLAPAHRMILFWIARQVPNGQTEARVNRTGVARELDTNAGTVSGALSAGEACRLCRVLTNGRVAFTGYDGLLGEAPQPQPVLVGRPAVTDAPPADVQPVGPRMVPSDVFRAFASWWEPRYRQKFVVEASYPRVAKTLCCLTSTELDSRLHAYFHDADPFWAECKHSFGAFARNINRFVPEAKAKPRPSASKDASEYIRQQREKARSA